MLVRSASNRGQRIQFCWFEPCRITAVQSPLVFGVLCLRGGKTEKVHCALLMKYSNSLLAEPVPYDMLDLADRTETRFQVFKKNYRHWWSSWWTFLTSSMGRPTWQPRLNMAVCQRSWRRHSWDDVNISSGYKREESIDQENQLPSWHSSMRTTSFQKLHFSWA